MKLDQYQAVSLSLACSLHHALALREVLWRAGIDKAARDMTQMQRSSQQIERALERVKIIQRGAGTLVTFLILPCAPPRINSGEGSLVLS